MLHLICDSILSIYCQSCYSVCKPDIDLVLDVHPVERPARTYRNTSRAPRGRCLDPHVQVFLLDEHLGQGRYPIHIINQLYRNMFVLDYLFPDICDQRTMVNALEEHDGKVSIGGRSITNLRFADDIDGLAEEEQELEA